MFIINTRINQAEEGKKHLYSSCHKKWKFGIPFSNPLPISETSMCAKHKSIHDYCYLCPARQNIPNYVIYAHLSI